MTTTKACTTCGRPLPVVGPPDGHAACDCYLNNEDTAPARETLVEQTARHLAELQRLKG